MPPALSESLVYLSEQKLWDVAHARNLVEHHVERRHTTDAQARVSLPILPGTGVSAEACFHSERDDRHQARRATVRALEAVIKALDGDGLPHLESGTRSPRDGEWFRFHRDLRFGYGCSEDDHSIAALVLVDHEPVDRCGRAGLLMTGSPWHLRGPYRPPDGTKIYGARSGSGTGRLFEWLETVRRQREANEPVSVSSYEDLLFRREDALDGHSVPVSMYRLFASVGWIEPSFPQLTNAAPCDGVAQVSRVSVDGDIAVVMASPLYVRVLSLPVNDDGTDSTLKRPRKKWLGRASASAGLTDGRDHT